MVVDSKKAEVYLKDVMESYDSQKDSLDPIERRLVGKYREAQSTADRVIQDLNQLRAQVKQAEARIRSLELQAADSQGKANGYLDFLVSMKFELEDAQAMVPETQSAVQ